jgi:hypothetical protein
LTSIARLAGVLGACSLPLRRSLTNLNQMNSGSDFLKDLPAAPTPHSLYHSGWQYLHIKQALPKPGEEDSRMKRLMERLFHSTTNLAPTAQMT